VKFLDLDREYSICDWRYTMMQVFNRKAFINGPQVKEFETKIAESLGVKHAIGVSSGTDAIKVAMLSLGLEVPHVLTTPYTFIATVEVPISLGATVFFCDIGDDFNIDMEKAKEIVSTQSIDVFIPVHLFGKPCDLDEEFVNLCRENKVYIIEDACQSMGSKYKGKYVGTIGDLGCFSFFPSKNLGAAGDGGLITTNNTELYEKCLAIRNHGGVRKYEHEMIGGNYRLDTIQAAILLSKLRYLDRFLNFRVSNASFYKHKLQTIEEITLPTAAPDTYHTYNQFVIRTDDRDELRKHLDRRGIPTALYYPKCLSEQPVFADHDFGCLCEKSKSFAQTNLALPIAYLNIKELQYIVRAIGDHYAK